MTSPPRVAEPEKGECEACRKTADENQSAVWDVEMWIYKLSFHHHVELAALRERAERAETLRLSLEVMNRHLVTAIRIGEEGRHYDAYKELTGALDEARRALKGEGK